MHWSTQKESGSSGFNFIFSFTKKNSLQLLWLDWMILRVFSNLNGSMILAKDIQINPLQT